MKDIFGKSGRHLLSGIAEQKDLEAALATIPSPRILRRADQLRETLQDSPLSPTQLHLLGEIEEKIAHLDELILASLEVSQMDTLAICTSVPGISILRRQQFSQSWEMFGASSLRIIRFPRRN